MEKYDTMRYVGSMQQMAFVRPVTYEEGRAAGMKAYDVKSGDLRFTLLADKCLDIAEFSYKGMNLNFLSKPGLQGRGHYDTNGAEALRSIMGGMLFTSGLDNICAPACVDGKEYPMHGRIRTTPAEHLAADAGWEGGRYVQRISAEMRQAELFGENLVLRRKISTCLGENCVTIEDEIENQSFRDEPMMILYHFNMGYPLVDESARIYLPVKNTTPRDGIAACHMDDWDQMEAPRDHQEERVYIHALYGDQEQKTMAMLVNEGRQIAVCCEYDQKVLPYFMEWKSTAPGDYVVGFEPANASVYGREHHAKKRDFRILKPFEKEKITIRFRVLENPSEIEGYKTMIQRSGRNE
ncbi:aldose 1-epimerase family protein [Ruminococcus gauvreauii]|uniref:Aldose 1-epimerase family protein n=1 Tax=Ruminococcus gauvreauii TaxID=438033 RepID=A0ABY5VLR4_9FIRM|nr:aldose 1-epimerase family protein [Ruminococcus gauvreauii]UWP60800.1 aldose 1-epimerase family protein [Ruminococcus gauvreauii]